MNVQSQGVQIEIPIAHLHPSPLNPRRTFDPAGLEELALSIDQAGLLEPPIVRHSADGTYELVAGERRYRALQLLIERGRIAADQPIKCELRDVDDATLRSMALIENLQREELSALDEGEALAQLHELDPKAWTTARIAEQIGKTQRYVQYRIGLVRKLSEAARQAFAAGRITQRQALELAGAAPAHQDQLIKQLGKFGSALDRNKDDPTSLRAEIEETWIPLSRAIFPIEQYKGPIHEEDLPALYETPEEAGYEPGEKVAPEDLCIREAVPGPFATDRTAFLKLQKKAAKIKAAELGTEWAWAEVMSGYFDAHRFEKSKDKSKAGCIVLVSAEGNVEIKTGLVKRKEAPREDWQARQAAENKERAEREKQIKPWLPKLRDAVRARPVLAKRLALAAIIDRLETRALGEALKLKESALDAAIINAAADAVDVSLWQPRDEFAIAVAKLADVELPECWQPKKAGPEAAAEKPKKATAPAAGGRLKITAIVAGKTKPAAEKKPAKKAAAKAKSKAKKKS